MQTQRLEEIIQKFHSADHDIQGEAKDQLRDLSAEGLSLEAGLLALKAAADEFPARKFSYQSTSSDLIRAAGAVPQEEYLPIIRQDFSIYDDGSKSDALQIIAKIDSKDASTAFVDLVCSQVSNPNLKYLGTNPLLRKPRDPEIFFPKIMSCCTRHGFRWEIFLLLLTYLQKGVMPDANDPMIFNAVKESYASVKAVIEPAQQAEGTHWMWQEAYIDARNLAGLLLDVMGYLPQEVVLPELKEVLSFYDPRLKYFAVQSLFKLQEEVDDKVIFELAASAEVRGMLFYELRKLDLLERYPEEYYSRQAFAEFDMVNWLIFPTELGQMPDQIELMKVVEIDTQTEDGIIEYYVFRFRTLPPHWAAEDGWMAGVSGPYLQTDKPGELRPSGTFSSFKPWKSMSAEQHVGDVQDILENWAQNRKRG